MPDQNQPNPPTNPTIPTDDVVSPVNTGAPVTADTPPVTTATTSGGGSKRGQLIATIFGLLLLVGGVGAGIALVGNQQLFQQKADVPPPPPGLQCSTTTCGNPGEDEEVCYVVHQKCSNYTPNSAGCTANPVFYENGGATFDEGFCGVQQIDMGCRSPQGVRTIAHQTWGQACGTVSPSSEPNNPSQCVGSCFGPTYNGNPVENCGSVGYDPAPGSCSNGQLCCQPRQPAPTPTPTPRPQCGGACTQTSDCRPAANGGTVTCANGICQNATCIGKTIPGANCDCSALNACGQQCSASLGLCQAGSECRYVVGPACTNALGTTYCVPIPLPTGWQDLSCVARDQGNNYVLNPAGQNPTLAQIQEACNPTPVAPQCTGVTIYDTNWNLLTAAQLSALRPNDRIRLVVAGSASSGVFDRARFTVNGTLRPEVTTTMPNNGNFYDEYIIPAGTTTFNVSAQIHHAGQNNWY